MRVTATEQMQTGKLFRTPTLQTRGAIYKIKCDNKDLFYIKACI